MTLSTGTKLSHYEITSQLGKGGMGEVYQAIDTKLGRSVAIKVLPEEFAKDGDRIARFQREAKLLASLNHPNIAAIHGLEEVDGTNFLVMELVEGQTLDERIKSGPIPVEEALKLALQIAEALEAAHEKGVIHRDLKPANIKVTPDGKVKVLDFGLAKAFAGEQDQVSLSNSPTLSDMATQQGLILGTAAYMSPEQARGKEVNKRADIWAFGVVLFEMLTGRLLFSGEDVSSTLARVLEREPDFSSLPANLHHRIRLLLKRCLKKDPKSRYHDMGDARVDIQDVLADPSGVLAQPIPAAKPLRKLRLVIPWVVAVFILGLVLAGVTVWKLKTEETNPVTRFDYTIPDTQELMSPQFPMIAVSPDGRHFVYISSTGLYLHSINTMETRLLVNADEDPIVPFFSFDGQWIGYMSTAEGSLKKISINGGTPQFLCNTSTCLGASWGKDNRIVYSTGQSEIRRISANGGQPETLINADDLIFHPRLLPDEKSLIYTILDPSGEYQIAVQSLESKKRKILFQGDCAWYLPTGHLIYALGNNLFAVPFDPVRLEKEGDPLQIGTSVFRFEISAAPQYSVSESGTLIYRPGMSDEENVARRTLVWIDSEDKEEPVAITPDAYSFPKLSPDGNKVVMVVSDGINTRLWIWDFIRENLMPLTPETSHCLSPIWSTDGKRIVYFSYDEGRTGIYSKAWDGTGKMDTLYSGTSNILVPSAWAGDDGKTLLFYEIHAPNPSTIVNILTKSLAMDKSMILSGLSVLQTDIGMLLIEGGGEKKELLKNNFMEAQPQISPDGKWMAYVSSESGELEIWLRPFPDIDKGRCMVSTGGADSGPMWAPTGHELYYLNGDSMMVVDVGIDPINNRGKPKVLFQFEKLSEVSMAGSSLNIHPDGKRFLMLNPAKTADREPEPKSPRKINVVLNWFEELKEKVPVN